MPKEKPEKSLVELLEEALVKEDEPPYVVPRNWVWAKIGSINHRKSGNVDPRKFPSDKFELYSVPSFADNFPEILEGRKIKSSKQAIKEGDILLCKINPRINRVWMVGNNTEYRTIGSSEWIVITPSNEINNEYLLWVLRSNYFRNQLTSNVSGVGGSLTRAKPTNVALYPIPIPPLPEQKRIVKKLSSMLGRLKEARELIQEARDTFEERRAAILNKAFTGELTKKWRQENPDVASAENLLEKLLLKENNENLSVEHSEIINRLPGTWRNVPSMHLFSFVTSGSRGWAKYYSDKGAIFIRITNLDYNSIELNIDSQKTKFVDLPDKVEGKRSRLQKDDILFSITGDVGMIAIIPTKFPEAYINQHIALARPIKGLVVKYIGLFLASRFDGLAQLKRKQKGATKAGLGLNDIKTIEVPFPPIEEQKEIVRILVKLLDHEDEAKALIDMEEQINLIEKSILSKAFRGELGTNDPNNEPAIELLKKSLKEKAKASEKPKAKSAKAKSA